MGQEEERKKEIQFEFLPTFFEVFLEGPLFTASEFCSRRCREEEDNQRCGKANVGRDHQEANEQSCLSRETFTCIKQILSYTGNKYMSHMHTSIM